MTENHQKNKQFINKFRAALYDTDSNRLEKQLSNWFAPDCQVHLSFPFEDLEGSAGLYQGAYRPLLTAVPDLERRDFIVMAGRVEEQDWIGCGGHYVGVFRRPFLDIPPTQHAIYMRYHEFFRIKEGQIVEMQALWDIPSLMMQAQAWPMSPSLAVEWFTPGPATQDGLHEKREDPEKGAKSLQIVKEMLTDMGKYPQNDDPAIMQLEKYWHPKMTWYGPAGIGAMRGIEGFRNWHQTPFLKAMPDRRGSTKTGYGVFFAEGDYVGVTGWPNMQMTVSGDGWMGIAPANREITMRSLDFWRCEDGLIRENWVLIDVLSVYDQLGVNVFERMRELTVGRRPLGATVQ